MLLTYTIVDIHLFYDLAVDIQIWARSECKVPDAQVTVKACRPFVYFGILLFRNCVIFIHIGNKYRILNIDENGFASVDIGFLGVTISHVTFSCSQYLYKNQWLWFHFSAMPATFFDHVPII